MTQNNKKGAMAAAKAPMKSPNPIQEEGQLSLSLYHVVSQLTTVDSVADQSNDQIYVSRNTPQQPRGTVTARTIEAALNAMMRRKLDEAATKFENTDLRKAYEKTNQRHLNLDVLMKHSFALSPRGRDTVNDLR